MIPPLLYSKGCQPSLMWNFVRQFSLLHSLQVNFLLLFFLIYSYLHATNEQYGRPIAGQREIVGHYSSDDPGSQWIASVFILLILHCIISFVISFFSQQTTFTSLFVIFLMSII